MSARPSPASLRSAISRAYYGAFHLSRNMLAEMGFRCHVRENEHLFVHRHFANCRQAQALEVGGLLANLHENRKKADYDLDDARAETQGLAILCVERADRLRDRLKACREHQILAVVVSEMTAYRKAANIG